MADTTAKGFPYPEGPDAVDVAGDIQALAEAVDDMPGVQSYTGAEITALTAGEKWAGRIVWNSTTSKLQVSNGSTFSDVDTSVALASTTPAALGVAAVGNGTTAARDNHVHAMPSASDVGAIGNSLVDAAGDLIVGSADNTVGRLALGSDGQVLTVDTAGTGVAKVKWADAAAGGSEANRNLVINGAMQVAQRNTSASGVKNGYVTADRWLLVGTGGQGFTASVEADGPTGSGLTKSYKLLVTTANASPAAGDIQMFEHRLEGQDLQRIAKGTASAQQLTLSFWVKSNVTGTYIAYLRDNDNTRVISASYSISASATWEKKTITFPADTTGALDNDNGLSLILRMHLMAGTDFTSGTLGTTWGTITDANRAVGQTNLAAATNNYWQVTGVQLETGPVATPFEFEPFEATLRKCQRYYQRFNVTTSIYVGLGVAYSTTAADIVIPARPQMRATPTSLDYANLQLTDLNANTNATSAALTARSGRDLLGVAVDVASGLTTYRPYYLRGSSDGHVGFSAEL